MQSHWYALYVKTRNELKVAKRLEDLGITVYCPVRIEKRQWSDRIKNVKVPLLPSMLLVQLPEARRAEVFDVPGALRYLFWSGKPAVIPQEEIDVLRLYSEGPDGADAALEVLAPGDTLNLDAYGFKGEQGIVEKVSNNLCWLRLKKLGFVIKVTRNEGETV